MIEIIERTSEDQWLEERRTRTTATDISRLANGGPAAWAAVKGEKHGITSFTGNVYTRWGHEREPLIAAHMEFLTALTPNDSLYVNGARAATPDGVSLTQNGEYKTTVTDWALTIAALPVRYIDQVYWAQLVREVDETVFAWEPHEKFIPGPIRHLTIPRDEKRIAELIEVEAKFRDYMEEDAPSGEFADLIARAAERKRILDEASAGYDDIFELIRARAGDREIAEKTPFGSISLGWPKPRVTFDATAFKVVHPDLHAQFMKETPPSKPTLRVTV